MEKEKLLFVLKLKILSDYLKNNKSLNINIKDQILLEQNIFKLLKIKDDIERAKNVQGKIKNS